jgi:hypothetical protein
MSGKLAVVAQGVLRASQAEMGPPSAWAAAEGEVATTLGLRPPGREAPAELLAVAVAAAHR